MDLTTIKPPCQDQREIKKLISWVISSISHELRTPLTTILSSAELLEYHQYQWSDEQKLKHLEQIQRASLAIREILDSEDFSANLQKLADQIREGDRVYQLCQILLKDNE
jgi:K+-sensing histidine kinase KdpD